MKLGEGGMLGGSLIQSPKTLPIAAGMGSSKKRDFRVRKAPVSPNGDDKHVTWQYFVSFVGWGCSEFIAMASAEVDVISGHAGRREADDHHIRLCLESGIRFSFCFPPFPPFLHPSFLHMLCQVTYNMLLGIQGWTKKKPPLKVI